MRLLHSYTDKPDFRLLHFGLVPVQHEGMIAFAALQMRGEFARVFCNHATDPAQISAVNQPQSHQTPPMRRTVIRGSAGLFFDIATNDGQPDVSMLFGNVPLDINLCHPDLDLFRDANTLMGTVNSARPVVTKSPSIAFDPMADPSYLLNWISYHAKYHGLDSALLLNRLGPEKQGQDLAERLRKELAKRKDTRPLCIGIIDIPVPTGKSYHSDAQDLLYAPEAPGKGRMTHSAVNQWLAPFGDEVLLEFARHAFLSKAKSATYLDPSDWFHPPANPAQAISNLAATLDGSAYLSFKGRRVFAWRYRTANQPHIGDHICRPFDTPAQFSRWAVNPSTTNSTDIVWRPHRIIGLEASEQSSPALWRFSGLRHPKASPAELVPKSSLREDPDLVALSSGVFDYIPVRTPAAPKKTALLHAKDRGKKIVLVTCMKNEGPFLLEWIAYHRAIGVSNIVVFTNDCTDGTDDFLDVLAQRGLVEHHDNPYRQMQLRPQHAGFRAAESLPTVQNADWLMTLDVDEYINIHVGKGHLNDLFDRVGDANLISCTWRLFGNGGQAAFRDDFVTRQFIHCATKAAARPHQAWGFKTLYQNNGYFKKLGVHRPKGLRGHLVDQLCWVNGSGNPMPENEFRNGWRSNTQTIGYDLVTLNHYAVRSTESFLVKRDRGRVNHVDRDQGAAYWFRMNHNTTQDTSIQRMLPLLEDAIALLMSDPEIKAAHETCVRQHRDKITTLLQRPEERAFFESLNASRAQMLSRMLPMFGANVFLAGPDAVPQSLIAQAAEGSLPDGHYFTVPRPTEQEH